MNLRDLYLYQNNLTTLNANSFGRSLENLRNFNAQFNRINEIDHNFFDRALNLYALYLFGNVCGSFNIVNVINSREQVRNLLSGCFRNFGYVECNYIDVEFYGYFCEMTVNNLGGREFERILGNHQTDKNDDDVFRVEAMEQETLNIPSVICSQFRNLRELAIIESDVEVVTAGALRECRNLEVFALNINKVKVLPDGLFGNSPNLEVASFYWNEISEIGERAFAGTRLWMVELECKLEV